jgi:hypothetical protein
MAIGNWLTSAMNIAKRSAKRKERLEQQSTANKLYPEPHYGNKARRWVIKASSIHDQWNNHCSFGAYNVTFSDSFTSEWNSEDIYGRNDPSETYQGTERQISLSFDVPAGSDRSGPWNLYNLSKFIRMSLYPKYNVHNFKIQDFYKTGNTREEKTFTYGTFNDGPVIKLKMWNWITSAQEKAIGGNAPTSGLVGRITGLDFSPNYDAGIIPRPDHRGVIYPISFTISFDFVVYDEIHMGFEVNTEQYLEDFGNYPYRASTGCTPRASFPKGTKAIAKSKVSTAPDASGLQVHPAAAPPQNASQDSRTLAAQHAAAEAAQKKARASRVEKRAEAQRRTGGVPVGAGKL